MKKILSLLAMLMAVVVMTATVGAADELDASKIYKAANKKMESVGTMVMRGNMKMILEAEEEPLETSMGLNMTMITRGDDLQMMMTAKSEDLGITTDVYFKDGYYYQKVGDLKVKSKMDVDAVMAETVMIDTESITEEMMKNATAEKVEGGVKLKFVMKSEDINEMVSGVLDGMLSETDEEISLSYGDMLYTMVIGDNGYIDSMQMAFVADIKTEEETMRVKYAVNLKVTAINAPVAIPYPRDLDSYVEM